jgi:hypothetical protein
MRGRFSIIIFIGAMIVLLVGLNAASYVRVEQEAELEIAPDRSTLNAGASGTRALYEFLEETGQRVMRWREPPAALARASNAARPATFVVVGVLRVGFKEEEVKNLMQWVEGGGRLVVIDRTPHASLVESDEWSIVPHIVPPPELDVRADDTEALTRNAPPLAPTQPTLYTRDVERIAPSRFASRLRAVRNEKGAGANEEAEDTPPPVAPPAPVIVERAPASQNENADDEATTEDSEATTGSVEHADDENANDETVIVEDTPPPKPRTSKLPEGGVVVPSERSRAETPASEVGPVSSVEANDAPLKWSAPVFHVSDERGALLLDFAHGKGRIVVLSDPYIVANQGINRADNLQLAANIIKGSGDGLVAFDEYHQGRGATRNELAAYFAGTPVLAMGAQLFLLAVAIVWTRGRRFARPLPAARVDRRSKLEFVASMAELQQRARAFDLAIENVYGRTRRALARYAGADVSAPRAVIAAGVAARSGRSRDEIEALMRECEDAINGAPVNARHSLALVASLRELERALGIRMRAREIRQAGRL